MRFEALPRALAFWLLCLAAATSAWGGGIETNAVAIPGAPQWLKAGRVDKVVDRIQDILEWDIRKVQVNWYADQAAFEKIHGFGPSVLAIARKSDNTVHVGPSVTDANFDGVFGHELTHVILFQKYKDAIPKWLEEGLANHVGRRGHIDYAWLAAQPPRDLRTLEHPFKGISGGDGGADHVKYHYMASTALIEMIASKCELSDLLQLSVGSRLESYLSTYCGIEDVNAEFRKWLGRKKDPKRGGRS